MTDILLLISLLYTYRNINSFICHSLIFLKAFAILNLFIVEIAPFQLITKGIYLVLFIENLHIVISYILFTKIYKLLLNVNHHKFIRFGSFLFIMVLILNLYLAIDELYLEVLNYALSCSNLIFTIYSIFYLVQSSKKKSVFEIEYFWLNISFLVYNAMLFSVMLFRNIILLTIKSVYIIGLFWSVIVFADVLFNFFLAIFLFNNRNKKVEKINELIVLEKNL